MSLPAPSETEESCEKPPQTSLAHCAKRRQAKEPVPAGAAGAGRGLWRNRLPSPGHYSPGRRQIRGGFSPRPWKLVHQNPPGELQVVFISPSLMNFRTRARVPRAQGRKNSWFGDQHPLGRSSAQAATVTATRTVSRSRSLPWRCVLLRLRTPVFPRGPRVAPQQPEDKRSRQTPADQQGGPNGAHG